MELWGLHAGRKYPLRPEIRVLKMDKMNVSITKTSLDTTICKTSISGRREYEFSNLI